MDSLTKRPLTEAELNRLVKHAFGPAATVDAAEELTEGTFSTAYALRLGGHEHDFGGHEHDFEELVLKVAPPPELPLLTYEHDLMHGEVLFYRLAAAVGVPVPRVRFADLTRAVHPSDYVFVSRLPGTPLNHLDLPPDLHRTLRHELGGHLQRLHTVRGQAFGYPRRDGRTRASTWRAAFLAMLDDIVDDGRRLATDLLVPVPAPLSTICDLVRGKAAILDEPQFPVLVHFDIWDGNVFVDDNRIAGLIDGERCFFGDPLAEFASLTLFTDLEARPELLAGYGKSTLTSTERLRLRLYTIYLYLLMLVEGPTRGFGGPRYEEIMQRTSACLEAELSAIS